MRPLLSFISLIFLVSCGKKDDTGSTPTDESPCSSTFTLTLADGTNIEFDECGLEAAEINWAEAPDSIMPKVHRLSYIFRGSTDLSVECWILWELDGICGERDTHSFGTAGSTLGWNTLGCGLPDAARGAFEAINGGSLFTKREVVLQEPERGLVDGVAMGVEIHADIDAESANGSRLSGTVVIQETLPLSTIPYAGCEGANGDQDRDGSDAVEFGGEDCDDNDPQIGPHAEEVCDEIDNDCDGEIDEDKTLTFYLDLDGDGYGDSENNIQACEGPEGTSEEDGDCDDDNPDINPGASEVCDGLDNDCDGEPDDAVGDAIYVDSDGDGYGDGSPVDVACPGDVPEGFSTAFGDCDEDDPSVSPAATEVCDEIDNDCDGEVDEGC